jgi:hypothetical protein
MPALVLKNRIDSVAIMHINSSGQSDISISTAATEKGISTTDHTDDTDKKRFRFRFVFIGRYLSTDGTRMKHRSGIEIS